MPVSISICNLALGDIRAPAIVDINEKSLEAGACATYYPHCLAILLDDYTWEFTKVVADLALLTTNDRAPEWSYCYALPLGCSQAIKLMPTNAAVTSSTRWQDPFDAALPTWWMNFVVESDKLYCQVTNARLEYTAYPGDEATFPPLFREALRKLLAANLAIPIRDSRELEADLFKQAERARQQAIASDMNRAPRNELGDDIAWARR